VQKWQNLGVVLVQAGWQNANAKELLTQSLQCQLIQNEAVCEREAVKLPDNNITVIQIGPHHKLLL